MNDVVGLDNVLRNLNSEIEQIKGRSMDGLLAAGLTIQREAQINLKPSVVTGNLRASAYTRKAMDGSMAVEIGFTANYAAKVHEKMEGRSPKYLERAINDNINEIIEQIQRRVKQ